MTDVTITTQWYDDDTLQCFHGETLVAEAFFNGGEWIWFAHRPDGEVDTAYSTGYWIEVDPRAEAHMRDVQIENAKIEADAPREAAEAALKARRRMFRDDEELRDLVRMRAQQLARTYVRTMNYVEEVKGR